MTVIPGVWDENSVFTTPDPSRVDDKYSMGVSLIDVYQPL